MTDHNFRFRQQWGKVFRITLIVEDRGFERRCDLGENPRRDRGREMAEKQGFHRLPSPTPDESAIVALQSAVAKGLKAEPVVSGCRFAAPYFPMTH
jgi:hypothetical protein